MRLKPPQPSYGKAETVDGVLRYELVDGQTNPRWWLRFQNLTSSRANLTARDQLDAYLETLKKNDKPFTTKVNEDLPITGASGESRILIIETPIDEHATGLSGWLIVPNGTDRFLTCSIIATSADFDASWPALHAALKSIEVQSLETVAAAKKERMDRGEKLLAFTADDLRAALASDPVYYRIYRPHDPDSRNAEDTEVGWMSVRVIEGARGTVDGMRDPSKLRGEDTELGMLAVIEAKSIVNADATNSIDTQIRSWMSWDRQDEVWSVRSTQRQGTASRTSAQTGVRSRPKHGDPRPKLRVINSSAEKLSRDPQEWLVPPNYLSQAELVVLGKLLPREESASTTFASYAFDPKSNGLPQRLDAWTRNPDGTWTLESRIGGSTAPLVQVFDANGTRIKRVDVDATGTVITERIELDKLRSLWKRKGLPLE